jgi:hypothetical protein
LSIQVALPTAFSCAARWTNPRSVGETTTVKAEPVGTGAKSWLKTAHFFFFFVDSYQTPML